MRDWLLCDSARCNLGWPLHHKGHTDTALKLTDLPAAEGLIDVGQANVTGTPIVVCEDNQGVIGQTRLFQRSVDTTHTSVKRADHGSVNPCAVRRDVAHCLVILTRCLQGCMYAPMT